MTRIASRLATERPNEIALRAAEHALGWAEVDRILNRVANAVLALDLGERRRVAVFAENAHETVLAHVGGLLGSASLVPVSYHLTPEEVAYILEDSGAGLLFVDASTAERGIEAARLAGVPNVVGWRCPARAGLLHWEAWLEAAPGGEPPLDLPPRPPLMYTSGTTGRPKGTELPPTMFYGGATLAEHLDESAKKPAVALGTHLVVGPLYHTAPLFGARLFAGGAPVVVLGRFEPEAVLQAIQRYAIGSTVMVPTHFVRLLALSEEVRGRYDVSSLKHVFHTGSSCPVDVKRRMIEWWGHVFTDGYGASEAGVTCRITSEEWLEHPGSVGRCVPPFSVLVVDDKGNELPPGTEGRLYFVDETGRGVIYPNDAEKSAEAHLRPGVFTLGEIGYVDRDGYVFITDRFSDMIVSGGVNIYPAESEQVLIQHAEVADIACIGVPHAEMGEELKALVVPRDPANAPEPDGLLSFCRERIAHYKCPRSVEFVDSVGRNPMGKINKRKLRAPWWNR